MKLKLEQRPGDHKVVRELRFLCLNLLFREYIYKHTLDPRKKIQMWITIGPEILSNGTDVWAKTKHTSGGVNRSQFAERLGYFSRTGLFQSPTGKHVRLVFGGISTKLCSTRVVSRHVCWMFILFLLSLSLTHTHTFCGLYVIYIYREIMMLSTGVHNSFLKWRNPQQDAMGSRANLWIFFLDLL